LNNNADKNRAKLSVHDKMVANCTKIAGACWIKQAQAGSSKRKQAPAWVATRWQMVTKIGTKAGALKGKLGAGLDRGGRDFKPAFPAFHQNSPFGAIITPAFFRHFIPQTINFVALWMYLYIYLFCILLHLHFGINCDII
jgi:hypothetical protein